MCNNKVNKKMKVIVAANVLKTMISNYANGNQKKFDNEFMKFAKSKAYDCLFDFDTGVWKEGPVYLNCIYKELKYVKRDIK